MSVAMWSQLVFAFYICLCVCPDLGWRAVSSCIFRKDFIFLLHLKYCFNEYFPFPETDTKAAALFPVAMPFLSISLAHFVRAAEKRLNSAMSGQHGPSSWDLMEDPSPPACTVLSQAAFVPGWQRSNCIALSHGSRNLQAEQVPAGAQCMWYTFMLGRENGMEWGKMAFSCNCSLLFNNQQPSRNSSTFIKSSIAPNADGAPLSLLSIFSHSDLPSATRAESRLMALPSSLLPEELTRNLEAPREPTGPNHVGSKPPTFQQKCFVLH